MKKTSCSDRFGHKPSYLITIALAASALFIGAQTATAAEWRIEPVFRLGYEYDDNATLNAVAAPSEISGYIVDGSATFGYATQTTTFDFTPLLRSRHYDDDVFDSDDGFLTLDLNHQGLKSNFRLRGNYRKESVRTAERANADPGVIDPDEIPGNDTGRVFATDRREQFRILPQWSYDISEKSALAAKLDYSHVDYDNTLVGTFIPYSDLQFEASFSRKFSTRTRGYIAGSARQYRPDTAGVGNIVDLDGTGFNIGFEQSLTQTTRFRAQAGLEETKPTGGQSESNVVWDISLTKRLETVRLLAQYQRSMNASGDGSVSQRDSFNLGVTKQFSGRLDGGLAVRAYTTDPLSSAPGSIEQRDYAQIQAQLTYAFSRAFSVQADYRYTYLDRSSVLGNGDSNSIVIWLVYAPRAMSASR